MINGRPASAGKAAPKWRIWRRCGQFLIRDDEVFDLACQPADDAWGEIFGSQKLNAVWTCFEPKFVRTRFHQNQVILSGLFLASHFRCAGGDLPRGQGIGSGGGLWSCDFVSQAGMGRCRSDARRLDSNLPTKPGSWCRTAMDFYAPVFIAWSSCPIGPSQSTCKSLVS